MASNGINFVSSPLRDWHAHLPAVGLIALLATVVFKVIGHFVSPLRKFPGPGWAAWTNIYRLNLVLTNEYHAKLAELHEKYGPVVRLGPNTLDLDYPELIKTMYGTDNRWLKTEFYHSNSNIINGKLRYTMFSTSDPEENRALKRPIAKHYSQGAVLTFEPLIDNGIRDLCYELERRFIKGPGGRQTFDLCAWIAYATWDIVGTTTFSKPFGYLEKGRDFDGTIKIADQSMDYFSAVGQMPWLDFLMDKNPIKRIGPPNLGNALAIAMERVAIRSQGKDTNFDPATPDFLKHFIDGREKDPGFVDDGVMAAWTLIPLVAGADSTATTVRATMYYILMSPQVHEKLKEELRSADLGEIAQYSLIKNFPYLDAVLRESMRLHPGVSMMLERYVPAEGLKLPDGSYVPPKTGVGLNPYIIHRNKGVYGQDAEEFRPERWLRAEGESEKAFDERIKLYNKNDLTFGAGTRICLGRHLSVVEAYKIVATLVNRYDMAVENEGRDYKTFNRWFFRQEGLLCKLSERK